MIDASNVQKSVVVIEDDLTIVDVLRAILEDDGYRVTSCTDHEKGLATVLAEHPDLAIIDWRWVAARTGRVFLPPSERTNGRRAFQS